MTATFEVESTLTDRYQTTVPETVRRVLNLGKRDKIHYSVRPDGEVVLSRAARAAGEDPVIEQFLGFLACDMSANPARLQSIDSNLVQRIQSMTSTVEVDLDAPLSADDE